MFTPGGWSLLEEQASQARKGVSNQRNSETKRILWKLAKLVLYLAKCTDSELEHARLRTNNGGISRFKNAH